MSQVLEYKYKIDLEKNWLFLSILLIGAIPQILNGYALYLWILLLPLCWIYGTYRLDKNACLIILFSLSYTFFRLLHPNRPATSVIVFHLFYPLVMYESVIYICKRCTHPITVIIVLFSLVFCFAIWSIVNNLFDYVETGAIVNATRSIAGEDGIDLEGVVPATQHNSMLSMAIGGIGMLFIRTKDSFERKFKFLVVILSVFALLSTLHLLNRTGILMAVLSLIIGYFWDGLDSKKIFKTIGLLLFFLIVIYIQFKDSVLVTSVIDGFAAREINEYNGGAATGGGRIGRWLSSPMYILTHPFGSQGLWYEGRYVMAHNIWLDAGIDSGYFAFILLFIITFRFFKNLNILRKDKYIPTFYKAYIFLIIITILLQCCVEPLMRAFYPLFYFLFFIWGLMKCDFSFKKFCSGSMKLKSLF